ncbi:MAG: carboxypeptidase-like regulatory domain-containing protein [Planctomycetaceae bacterium]|nr:carboxypeptidase-like regulatory domain-containing protein [Planctomycetaceae bacterium]
MKKLYLLAILLTSLMIVGCGGGTKVTGTVKYSDGTPFTEGDIVFDNEATNVIGYMDSQGHFALFQAKPGDRVPPGTYRGTIVPRIGVVVPRKYTSTATSGLEIVVEPGKPLHLDIVMEDDPPGTPPLSGMLLEL